MATVFAVYTGNGLQPILQQLFAEQAPGHRLVNLLDDGIIGEVIRAGGVTRPITRRLIALFRAAEASGADVILNTCSSVGEIVPLATQMLETPILRIDAPMAAQAVTYRRVAVLATLPTTLTPSCRLLATQAALAGKEVSIVEGLANGAFQALQEGKPERHDEILLETALRLSSEADALVLAQGSMTRMLAPLQKAAGIPVLASPPLCMPVLRAMLEGGPI